VQTIKQMKRLFFLFLTIILIFGCRDEITEETVQLPLEEGVGDIEKGIFPLSRAEGGYAEDRFHKMIVQYMLSPDFSPPDFVKQVTGTRAQIRGYDREERLYFTIPEEYYSERILEQLTQTPERVEFGQTDNGEFTGRRVKLGEYILNKSGYYFIRFPAHSLRVDRTRSLEIPYAMGTYLLTMEELKDFFYNNSLYGGNIRALVEEDKEKKKRTYIANYGALVAKPGEPSLKRFARSLTEGATTKEQKAQILLDFVTTEIAYDQEEASPHRNILRRPNEVLMAGRSACGGKSVLYASLLEQVGIDYLFLYYIDHISVGVKGNFENKSGLALKIFHEPYFLAETTAEGFQIGRSHLRSRLDIENIECIQRPGEESFIYEVKTGEALPFD